ncbi:hypothetical protein [Flavobacterium sp. YO64]|uniref:hypothetical protein n=1 Tax=Flavobacterium sp. YO64 TaxID=394559 RepID=UPI00100B4A58|nr:hypothetical protein [Flavobacterium sp. YO64]RXM44180.1 hypothetical protein BOW57_09830 [Flavobacterium sp. YO64]
MNLIDQHIRQHLLHFQSEEDTFFQEIVASIQSEEKEKHILLLCYIHLLLDELFKEDKQETKTLHLHFEYDLDDVSLLVIAQYFLIRFFIKSSKTNVSTLNVGNLQKVKTKLKSRLMKLSTCPNGASGKNGGNRTYKIWLRDKKEVNKLLNFYNQFGNNIDVSANSIFNCQVRLTNFMNDIFATRPYACTIENYSTYPTFNLLNTKLTLNEIDETDNSIIDNLETVILFDCEEKKQMQYFSLQEIKNNDINLKNFLVLSFGNKNSSVQSLRDKLDLIQSRFKIPNNDCYPFLQSELDFVLGQKNNKHIRTLFIGNNNSDLWNTFVIETAILDLYELRSIKMMNLYSLCLNEEIKNFILKDIFLENDSSKMISDETKQKLLDLSDENKSSLKDSLENVLDLIIASDFKQVLSKKIKNETLLIVDDFILKTKKMKQLLSSSLQLSAGNKLCSWFDFKNINGGEILVLSYQDQGKYPYYFYPNIIETTVSKNTIIGAIYHKFLFSNRYQWAKYNVANEFYKLSNHPIRQKYFQWERLKKSINSLRPQKEDNTIWDLEQQYSSNSNRETIKLKLKGEREKTFNSSELFIYTTDNKAFKVEKIETIVETIDKDEKYYIHHLDEIQESINLYEKMIDTTQQEEELNVIRQKFQIDEDTTGRLWKLLLKQRALNSNEELLYEELGMFLENKGLKIVSFLHFKNNWLSPESESIAPLNKKVFIELCNFLNLPNTYFILIQRLKNASKQSNRQSTRQMNRLLQDLFNDGSFDEGVDISKTVKANLEKYIRKHPLEELGIHEKYLGDNLITLVELIKAEVTLKELEKFKKVE